jgi:3-dehydroquinate synthase
VRKTLNLGHTAGHAIERCSDYSIPHGHAVAIGLAIIARASERLGWATEPIARRVEHALMRNGLPTTTSFTPEALAEAALSDKKRAGGQITLVVPKKIGECVLADLPMEQLLDVLRAGMVAGA